jgi:hypothetical protein
VDCVVSFEACSVDLSSPTVNTEYAMKRGTPWLVCRRCVEERINYTCTMDITKLGTDICMFTAT